MSTMTATPTVWTANDMAFLRMAYPSPKWTFASMAEHLGRPEKRVIEKANRMGLTRPVMPILPCSRCGNPEGWFQGDCRRPSRLDASAYDGPDGVCRKCYDSLRNRWHLAKRKARRRRRFLPPETIAEIVRLRSKGVMVKEVCASLGVSECSVLKYSALAKAKAAAEAARLAEVEAKAQAAILAKLDRDKPTPADIRFRWAMKLVTLSKHGRPWHQYAPDLLDETGNRQPVPTQAELFELTGIDPGPAPAPRRVARDATDLMRRAWKASRRDPLALGRVCGMFAGSAIGNERKGAGR